MNSIIKHLFLAICVTVMCIACGTIGRRISNPISLGSSMRVECNITDGKEYQIDSIITCDTLPQLSEWLMSVYTDYETKEKIYKRMCIKTFSDGRECVYLITGTTEPYKIVKRITE